MVITESIVKKYFGDENAIGKIITLDHGKEYIIDAVIQNLPANSDFQFEIFISKILKQLKNKFLLRLSRF